MDWTQPLCVNCLAAFALGRGDVPREPVQVKLLDGQEPDHCLVCGRSTTAYTRIDPKLTEAFMRSRGKP